MSRIEKEKRVVSVMVRLYCRKKEGNSELCDSCRQLLAYAESRLEHCPFGERKTSCRRCTVHCYKPSARSVVTAHYTGRTINGRTFDSSRGGSPLAARLSDLISGWSIAMQQMHIGDRWEVYIPAEMAYGKLSQPGIPGGSTLIFDMELLSVY